MGKLDMPPVATGEKNESAENSPAETVENIEMTENEKIATEWIKENGIKEGTELIIKTKKVLVTSVDFNRRVLILDLEERKNVSYSFEQMGSEMEESKNIVSIKESE